MRFPFSASRVHRGLLHLNLFHFLSFSISCSPFPLTLAQSFDNAKVYISIIFVVCVCVFVSVIVSKQSIRITLLHRRLFEICSGADITTATLYYYNITINCSVNWQYILIVSCALAFDTPCVCVCAVSAFRE